MKSLKNARNADFGLRNSNERAKQRSRYDPKVERRISDAMDFKADENRRVEGARVYSCLCSSHRYSNNADEGGQRNQGGKVFGCSVGGESIGRPTANI